MKLPLFLNERDMKLRKAGNTLLVVYYRMHKGRKREFTEVVPINTVSYVLKYGHVVITESCVDYLMENEIPIFRFGYGGKPTGMVLPPQHQIHKTHQMQYRFYDSAKRIHLARKLLVSAMKNRISVLKSYPKEYGWLADVNYMEAHMDEIVDCKSVQEMLLWEARQMRVYYIGLGKCIRNSDFSFQGREYHPPKDELNATLNFHYALLYSQVLYEILRRGMTPFIGVIHEPRNDAHPIIYDISEIFKGMVDKHVLTLVNTQQLRKFFFRHYEDGSCLLSTPGKKAVEAQWLKFLRRIYGDHSFAQLVALETVAVRKHIAGEQEYAAYEF